MRGHPKEFLVNDLLAGSIADDGYFRRLDIVAGYMAIEDYYGEDNSGWKLYEKYQKTSGKNVLKHKENFIRLINSFKENGCLTNDYPMLISTKPFLHIRNGAHRFSCALYFDHEVVHGRVKNGSLILDIGNRLKSRF